MELSGDANITVSLQIAKTKPGEKIRSEFGSLKNGLHKYSASHPEVRSIVLQKKYGYFQPGRVLDIISYSYLAQSHASEPSNKSYLKVPNSIGIMLGYNNCGRAVPANCFSVCGRGYFIATSRYNKTH